MDGKARARLATSSRRKPSGGLLSTMALSANLQLRQTQSLVMTPQLIQSIKLLQLTHLELAQFVEREVERNPLLELAGSESDAASDTGGERDDGDAGTEAASGGDWTERGVTAEGETLADRMDTSYENVFPDDGANETAPAPEFLDCWKSMPGANGASACEVHDLDRFVAPRHGLREHVGEQIAMSFRLAEERALAVQLADRLDEAGYLHVDLAELAELTAVPPAGIEAVLATLQTFDPPGLFARSLKECLAIQLRQRDRLDPAMAALLDNLELLARRDFAALGRICGVKSEDLVDMLAEIRALDPKPGMAFQSTQSEAIVPDVIVRPAAEGGWRVELNPQTVPRVLVDRNYYAHVCGLGSVDEKDREFLTQCLNSANWLTRSLDQRARTITRVASEIVRRQDAFLAHGPTHLRPLNLRAVAEATGMHESTVSRVTSNKYMMTPRGMFELKYFFTVSIASTSGSEAHSAEAVRQAIRRLVAAESADAVLSDDDIVRQLKSEGVDIARRTVAKYREAMHIPSSVSRRREKRALAARGSP